MTSKQIEARVAEVIDSTRIAFNVGSDQGVSEGDEATLWRTIAVRDPETGDELGETQVATLSVRVYDVKPRFCVAQTRVSNTALSAVFGKRPKISRAGARSSEEYVQVEVNDRATVYVTDVEDLV